MSIEIIFVQVLKNYMNLVKELFLIILVVTHVKKVVLEKVFIVFHVILVVLTVLMKNHAYDVMIIIL